MSTSTSMYSVLTVKKTGDGDFDPDSVLFVEPASFSRKFSGTLLETDVVDCTLLCALLKPGESSGALAKPANLSAVEVLNVSLSFLSFLSVLTNFGVGFSTPEL